MHFWRMAAATMTAILAVGTGALTTAAADVTAETESAESVAVTETTPAATEAVTEMTEAATEAATEAPAEAETEAETVAAGWEQDGGKRYYHLADGSLATGETVIDGVPYLFGFTGAEKTGWQTIDDQRRFYDPESGEAVFGWVDYFDNHYYISEESGKLTGLQTIDGKQYLFESNGALVTGFFADETGMCYADAETGEIAAGGYRDGDRVFFTDAHGTLQSGWQEMDGKRYYIDEATFFARYGFFEQDGKFYLGTADGLSTGESWIDGDRCLFNENGELCTGWYEIEGTRMFFDTGIMHVLRNCFADDNGRTYYLDANGQAVKGIQVINGNTYGFGEDGAMLKGVQEIDGVNYRFDEVTGVVLKGAVTTENGVVRYDENGVQMFGWHKAGDSWYYTNEQGYVVPGWVTIEDKEYKFDEEGKMISDGRLYNQFDPKWKQVTIGPSSGSTMYASACGIFSFCNAVFALNHNEADAVEVAQWAYDIKAYRPGGAGTYREIFYNHVEDTFGEALNVTVGQQIWGKITDSRLVDHLISGGVAVIHVAGHFMCVTGYNTETGLYHVLESAVSSKRGLEGDSWVTASKMSSGNSNVDWFVLLSDRS
ncbi:MAG: hypothetical protein IKN55_06305 [Oscillospiraceae bacterium]|nr:hypothetical protein [Oscillospiraceae bacterium]